jgi:hypothetical protein
MEYLHSIYKGFTKHLQNSVILNLINKIGISTTGR